MKSWWGRLGPSFSFVPEKTFRYCFFCYNHFCHDIHHMVLWFMWIRFTMRCSDSCGGHLQPDSRKRNVNNKKLFWQQFFMFFSTTVRSFIQFSLCWWCRYEWRRLTCTATVGTSSIPRVSTLPENFILEHMLKLCKPILRVVLFFFFFNVCSFAWNLQFTWMKWPLFELKLDNKKQLLIECFSNYCIRKWM